jgi:hypothetical protein
MNIIELKEDEISVVSGGMGYMPYISAFLGGGVGACAAAIIGMLDYVLTIGGVRNDLGDRLVRAFSCPRNFLIGAALISGVFLAANVGGAVIGWVISRPFVWGGLIADD